MVQLSNRTAPESSMQQEQSAPILQLPLELLQLIFDFSLPHCASSDPIISQDADQNFDTVNLPWTISHVCRHWRFVASSYPRLWTSFEVVGQRGPLSRGRLELLVQRIELSKGENLHIVLRQRGLVIDYLLLFDLLSRTSQQILSLELDFENSTHPAIVYWYQELSRTYEPFQSLKTLSLHLHKPQPTNRMPICILREARSLTSLSVKSHLHGSSAYQEELRRWYIPWTQLTYLHLDCLPWNTVLTILNTTTNLQHLSTKTISRFHWHSPEDLNGPENVTLPHLRSLRVRDVQQGEAMLSFMIAPSLEDINVETPWSPTHYMRMLASAPRTTRWTWMHVERDRLNCTREEIFRLLRAVSASLEEFILYMTVPFPALPDLLVAIPSLGALRRLEIHGLSLELDCQVLVQMLRLLGEKPHLESVVAWFDIRDEDGEEVWADLCTNLHGLQLHGARLWGQRHENIVYRWPLVTELS